MERWANIKKKRKLWEKVGPNYIILIIIIYLFIEQIACAIINFVKNSKAYNLKVRGQDPLLSKPEEFSLVKQLLK
jgi:hypothetical protein